MRRSRTVNPALDSRSSAPVAGEIWPILRPSIWLVAGATVLGISSGLATAWLLASVNRALHAPEPLGWTMLLWFPALCLLSVAGSAIAGVTNSVIGQRMIALLRKTISRRVSRAPLETIERYQSHRLLAILSTDVETISAFTFNFAGYAVAVALLLGSFAYLAMLSLVGFAIFLAAILVAIGMTAYSKVGWAKDYGGVRAAQDQLQQQFRAISEGAKELRLNQDRENQVHDRHLAGAADRIASLKVAAMKRFWVVDSLTNSIVFIAIGTLLALRGRYGLAPAAASGAILVILYVRAPIEQILNGLPAFFQAQVSLRRIIALSRTLDTSLRAPEKGGRSFPDKFSTIALAGASYAFDDHDGRGGFRLGPIDLTVHAGEILFIIGENGSGKTTLVKLLLGLYAAQSGTLSIDGVTVEQRELAEYRQLFSAVFSDYFLFADLLPVDESLDEKVEAYLADLEIGHKVDVRDAAFSTLDLSTGQRKRLALIHAYLEQRPIMLFDEWAADQDPTFRRVFYERILPDLKAQGKTLIVVSHDDRFFGAADRVVTLQNGRIVDERRRDGIATMVPVSIPA